nr:hypothetical protein [uncultured Oribacterium sp.]
MHVFLLVGGKLFIGFLALIITEKKSLQGFFFCYNSHDTHGSV